MKFINNNFIGIFDSGIGGISVLNRCLEKMPNEKYIYIADSNNFPYGKKSKDELVNIGLKILSNFNMINAKEVIIACNTMTTSNMNIFKSRFKNLNIVGTYPDFTSIFTKNLEIKNVSMSYDKANGLEISKKKIKILVIATTATCKSKYLKNLINEFKQIVDIYVEPADFIVSAVEKYDLNSFEFKYKLENLFKEYNDIDYLLLGCTHFSHALNEIKSKLKNNVKIIDGGEIAASNAYKYLSDNKLLNDSKTQYINIIDFNINESKANIYRKLIKSNSEILFSRNFEI